MSEALRFAVVIPARYASSRLPGKPLIELAGKPMIQWAWAHALEAGADRVIVATDDTRIADAVQAFGGDVCMTDPAHASGTDRIAEVCALRRLPDDAIVVNLQGDEPGVPAALLSLVARALSEQPSAGIATLATPITTPEELFDPNVVKTVLDDAGMALTFSRAPLPWVRDRFAPYAAAALPQSLPVGPQYLRHLGIYAYRVGTLTRVASAPAQALELAESLEQLRAMAMGVRVHVSVIAEAPGHGVDTEADIERAAAHLARVSLQ